MTDEEVRKAIMESPRVLFQDDQLMTQAQLAEKYHVDQTAVSTALAMADVPPATTTKALSKKPRKLYAERHAVMALIKLYQRRRDGHIQNADDWQERIETIKHIFEYGEE